MSKHEKMKEVLCEINDYLDRLINGVNHIIELYQGGNEGEANEMMINVIEGISWIIDGISATTEIQDQKIQIEDMNEHFVEIVSAFENTDYVLLSDLLEYEIIPILQDWKEKITITIER